MSAQGPQDSLGVPGTPPTTPEAVSGATSGQSGPSERLRRAADLIEQRAAAASGVKWEPEYDYGDGYGNRDVQAVFVECGDEGRDCGHDRFGSVDGTCAIGSFQLDEDNRWAVLMGPQVAGPLMAWLRSEAVQFETDERRGSPYGFPSWHFASILLGASPTDGGFETRDGATA